MEFEMRYCLNLISFSVIWMLRASLCNFLILFLDFLLYCGIYYLSQLHFRFFNATRRFSAQRQCEVKEDLEVSSLKFSSFWEPDMKFEMLVDFDFVLFIWMVLVSLRNLLILCLDFVLYCAIYYVSVWFHFCMS